MSTPATSRAGPLAAADLRSPAFMRDRVARELRALRSAVAASPADVARQHALTVELWLMHARPAQWLAWNALDWVDRLRRLDADADEREAYLSTKRLLFSIAERDFELQPREAMAVVERALVEALVNDELAASLGAVVTLD